MGRHSGGNNNFEFIFGRKTLFVDTIFPCQLKCSLNVKNTIKHSCMHASSPLLLKKVTNFQSWINTHYRMNNEYLSLIHI